MQSATQSVRYRLKTFNRLASAAWPVAVSLMVRLYAKNIPKIHPTKVDSKTASQQKANVFLNPMNL